MTLHLILTLNTMKILMKKSLKLNLVIMSEFKNTKTFLLKGIFKIGQKKVFVVSKIKNTVTATGLEPRTT